MTVIVERAMGPLTDHFFCPFPSLPPHLSCELHTLACHLKALINAVDCIIPPKVSFFQAGSGCIFPESKNYEVESQPCPFLSWQCFPSLPTTPVSALDSMALLIFVFIKYFPTPFMFSSTGWEVATRWR